MLVATVYLNSAILISSSRHLFHASFMLSNPVTGVSDDREGLFDTIQRSKAHSQKRGYQCIKAIVQLLNK